MQVTALWRYPVKSMQGEALAEATVGEFGIKGDRGWSLVNLENGVNLTARRMPELLFAGAKVVDGEVVITLPNGTETNENGALSSWLGRDVELRRADADDTAGTFETQADENETGEWFRWTGPTGSFHDSTKSPISLACAEAYRTWEPRRFRINVTLTGSGEDALVDHAVRVGSTTLHVMKRIDRCIMTTRPQPAHAGEPEIERDFEVLRTINRENETFLGIGAKIGDAGMISVGDQVTRVQAGV